MAVNRSQIPRVDTDPRLLEALASLNQISATINQIGPGDQVDINATLRLIAESATKVIPGAAAVIYTYDQGQEEFDLASRVSAGSWLAPVRGIEPRFRGMGKRAIDQRRRVISYEESDLQIHPRIVEAGAKVSACFPLIVAEQPVGALYVYLNESRAISQLEELMLENFVNQAAMAIFQAQRFNSVQRDLARKEEELKHLRRAGLLISSRLRLEDTLETILQMALEVTNAQYGIFRLMDKSGQYLNTRAIAGEHMTRPRVEALPVESNSIMGWVARNRQPVCVADLKSGSWSSMYYPLDADLQMRSELAVPLISGSGRLEGVLNLESPRVGAFTEQDSHMLQSFATQAVIAIQEVRLLDALQEITRLLLSQSCQQVLGRLSELACDLLNADFCAIWLLDDQKLDLKASNGACRSEDLALHDSLPGQAVLKRSLVTGSLPNQGGSAECGRERTQAMAVPLLADEVGEPLGAICIYSASLQEGYFSQSDWDKKVLTSLANYAALAVRNASHQEALQTAQQQRSVAETFAVVGDITANLLHQLNNKVGTIPVRVQGIQDKCQGALANDRYLAANLSEIERSANEAMEAVRENLSHLRPIHLAEVGVAACVSEAVEAANLPAGIQVRLEGLEKLPPVFAGQRSLTLVFTNLLENAADAMRGEGVITVRGTAGKGWVDLVVSDTGPGIPAELHDRIFELNYSGRNTINRNGKLGFGLWWVKTLMARLGGAVSVESDGAHGASFHLKLPIAEVQR
ncbi:MAG TPA: GAF domain-containing protein [Anaerolineaceae bacterium]|nr:GAF domain-containing protein [Anaerolineaceae bacterium]